MAVDGGKLQSINWNDWSIKCTFYRFERKKIYPKVRESSQIMLPSWTNLIDSWLQF